MLSKRIKHDHGNVNAEPVVDDEENSLDEAVEEISEIVPDETEKGGQK
jgi:hypothetical protein